MPCPHRLAFMLSNVRALLVEHAVMEGHDYTVVAFASSKVPVTLK